MSISVAISATEERHSMENPSNKLPEVDYSKLNNKRRIPSFALRLTELEMAKLKHLANVKKTSMHRLCLDALNKVLEESIQVHRSNPSCDENVPAWASLGPHYGRMFIQRIKISGQYAQLGSVVAISPGANPFVDFEKSKGVRKKTAQVRTQIPRKRRDNMAAKLAEIRDALGMQNTDLAALLGLSEGMLCFYLYNSRNNIPDRIMNEAKRIAEQTRPERQHALIYLSKTDVPVIVANWMTQLGIRPESSSANEELADKIHLDRSTVWRWRTGKHIPRMSLLVRTHFAVQELAKLKKSSNLTEVCP